MTKTMNPGNLVPFHEIRDDEKLAQLTADMKANGWVGAPIVVIFGIQDDRAITGTHRREAAIAAEIDVPVIGLDEILAEHSTSLTTFEEIVAEWFDEYDALVRLYEYLPAEVIEAYGIDIH